MKWSFSLAWKRIRYSIYQFAIVGMQVIIGMALLYISLSVQLSISQQGKRYAQTTAQQVTTISGISMSGDTLSILPEDYSAIVIKIQDSDVSSAYAIDTGIYIKKGDKDLRINVKFVTEKYYELLMNMNEVEAEGTYLGHKAREALTTDGIGITYGEFALDEKMNILFGVPLKDYKDLDTVDITNVARNYWVSSSLSDDYTFSNTIFLPIQKYEEFSKYIEGVSYLYLDSKDQVESKPVLQSILRFLNDAHPDAVYDHRDDLLELSLGATGQNRTAQLIWVIAILLLVIILFGLLGLFLLLAQKRRRSYIIARLCGASTIDIFSEAFFEASILVFASSCLGIVIGSLFLPMFSTALYPVRNQANAVIICLLLAGLISILVCLGTIMGIRESNNSKLIVE